MMERRNPTVKTLMDSLALLIAKGTILPEDRIEYAAIVDAIPGDKYPDGSLCLRIMDHDYETFGNVVYIFEKEETEE